MRQQFTGYEHDTETDLDFAEARYCSTKQGRFTSPDPLLSSAGLIEPQSWNRYSYVGNRPLIVTDPSGLKWFYNTKNNKYGWCACNSLSGADRDNGWTEIAGRSGDVIYESAGGSLILLPANSGIWRNLTGEVLDQARLKRNDLAKENAEKWANAILLDFITTSVEGAAAVLSGGGSVTLKAVAKEVISNVVEDYLDEATDGLYSTVVGGGASLNNLNSKEIDRIQQFTDTTGVETALVGSRAGGTVGANSDYDYVIEGNSKVRHRAKTSLPRGSAGGAENASGRETGIDILPGPVNKNKPHIIFRPRKRN